MLIPLFKTSDDDKVNQNNDILTKRSQRKNHKLASYPYFIQGNRFGQYLYNISNFVYLDEKTLKQPHNSDGTILQTIFSFNKIRKIEIIYQTLIIQLKSVNSNIGSIQYLIQRLNSYGDSNMHNIAIKLQKLKEVIYEMSKKQFFQENYLPRQKLQSYIKKNKNNNYFLYYTPIQNGHLTLKALAIPLKLLNILKVSPQKASVQYLRYQMITDQFISSKMYTEITMAYIQSLITHIDNLSSKQKQIPVPKFQIELLSMDNEKIQAELTLNHQNLQLGVLEVSKIYEQKIQDIFWNKKKGKKLQSIQQSINNKELQTLIILDSKFTQQRKNRGKTQCSYQNK